MICWIYLRFLMRIKAFILSIEYLDFGANVGEA